MCESLLKSIYQLSQKEAFFDQASKEFVSFDSDLDSMETVDTIWMEDEIRGLEIQIQKLTYESKMAKNELKQARGTISKLTKDLCSVILSSKLWLIYNESHIQTVRTVHKIASEWYI